MDILETKEITEIAAKKITPSSTKIKITHAQKLISKFENENLKTKHCDFQVFVLSPIPINTEISKGSFKNS